MSNRQAREVVHQVRGYRAKDGAGVSLVRVLGQETLRQYSPILMLDSFDSTDPMEYTAGFPMHPHRGIETISYVYKGRMEHRDSIGHSDTIGDGEVQWMTAGSGILHEERIPAAERLLGVQLWLNLPAKDKMAGPAYYSLKKDSIPEVSIDGGYVRILAGDFEEIKGFQSRYQPLDYYDVHVEAGRTVILPVRAGYEALAFTLLGAAEIGGTAVGEKTAVKLSAGDHLIIKAGEKPAQVLVAAAAPLEEPVAWGGPIVMNTRDELQTAFDELRSGTFLREGVDYDEA
ncbi:MAG: pirin family protein [Lachnospiraceae bacterium]|nr:pirin family protein [Lachnospiraceae bacterium]MDY5741614.1 pirin family protein [Lachnospiraceae bacterium]